MEAYRIKTETSRNGSNVRSLNHLLTRAIDRRMFTASKQIAAALTDSVYTKSIANRKPIDFTYDALVGCVVSSSDSPWAWSVSWDWMVSRVKVKSHPSIKPSVKRLTAKMTSMAPKSMKTVIRLPVLKHGLGMGAFNFTSTKEHIG